ncbi:hypothetical protein FF38_03970 [Lucilia cuprina]|uniref:Uncharacterized protein n=1 Tax=Lucilia cuprina TaxID=7375 RepID=A0A0L0CD31_LUCCU|nr:hypothetical protein FF38_03970 [Lucilia cuprina]
MTFNKNSSGMADHMMPYTSLPYSVGMVVWWARRNNEAILTIFNSVRPYTQKRSIVVGTNYLELNMGLDLVQVANMLVLSKDKVVVVAVGADAVVVVDVVAADYAGDDDYDDTAVDDFENDKTVVAAVAAADAELPNSVQAAVVKVVLFNLENSALNFNYMFYLNFDISAANWNY